MADTSRKSIGELVRDAREHRGLSQTQLADALGTSQSAVHSIELGDDSVSVDLIRRIAVALDSPLVAAGPQTTHLRIEGGRELGGTIGVRSSKNAGVALLVASLFNAGSTTIRGIARIEEVNRILEVLVSIGVGARWSDDGQDLTLVRPAVLDMASMDLAAARRTRSILMFLGPLLHLLPEFTLPHAGGCELGARTIEPHLQVFRRFGVSVVAAEGFYHCDVDPTIVPTDAIVLTQRSDMGTENALLAAALFPGETVLRNASCNYMVQDLCVFLTRIGVQIEGIGGTTLRVHGVEHIDVDVIYAPSEDPIEAMSLLTAAIVTGSELTVARCPVEFLETELTVLGQMGLEFSTSPDYVGRNGDVRLADITVRPSRLKAIRETIHPMPFPGLNIDNLPFFAVIAATAEGSSRVHDWVYENRAIHLLELNKIGAQLHLLDPHRLVIDGPSRWRGNEVVCPPALRPAVCVLLGMLAARGPSLLRNRYMIDRGYEDLPARLNALGASITSFTD